MWSRDTEWENAVGKMAPTDLLRAGWAQSFILSTIKQSSIKQSRPVQQQKKYYTCEEIRKYDDRSREKKKQSIERSTVRIQEEKTLSGKMLKDFTRKMDIVSEEMKNLRKDTETLKKYQVETLELKDLIYEIFKNS